MPTNPFKKEYPTHLDSHYSITRRMRSDSITKNFGLRMSTTDAFSVKNIDDNLLWDCARNEPIGHRITYGVARDTVNGWFNILDINGQPHGLNNVTQERFEKFNIKNVFSQAYGYCRIFGRSWIIRHKWEKDTEFKYYPVSNLDLSTKNQHTWDTKGNKQELKFRLKFTELTDFEPVTIKPEDYIFIMTVPNGLNDLGIPALRPCWNDIASIRQLRESFKNRIRKYGGFPHITVLGANKPVLEKAQDDWGDFDEMTEAWSNEETEIMMKGLEGVALNPEYFYSPYIEQVSIATGIPMPILRGMESGQLKAGQINMSSYYSVISNNQYDLSPPGEELAKWMSPSLSKFNLGWRLEYALSDIDRLSMRKIQAVIAVQLKPYITRAAFAREMGLPIKDLIPEKDWKDATATTPFGGGSPFQDKEGGPTKKEDDQGRKFGEKKDKTLRGMR